MVTTSVWGSVNPPCSLQSLPPLFDLAEKATMLGLKVRDFSNAVADAQASVTSVVAEKKILPIKIDLSRSAYATNDELAGANLRSDEETLEMSADVTPWAIAARRERFASNEMMRREMLKRQKAEHTRAVIRELIQIGKSSLLESLIEDRQIIYAKQFEYYDTLKVSGAKVSNELLAISESILESSDKLAALKVQQVSSALKINLPVDKIKSLNIQENIKFSNSMDFQCQPFNSIKYRVALFENQYIKNLLKDEKISQFPSIKFFNNYSQSKSNTGRPLSNNHTYGFKFSLNLYNGGEDAFALEENVRRLESSTRQLDTQLMKAQLALTQWSSTREIYLNSIRTLQKKLSAANEKNRELSERLSLGDSMFIDLTDSLLEISNIRENIISVESELLVTAIDVIADFLDASELNYLN